VRIPQDPDQLRLCAADSPIAELDWSSHPPQDSVFPAWGEWITAGLALAIQPLAIQHQCLSGPPLELHGSRTNKTLDVPEITGY